MFRLERREGCIGQVKVRENLNPSLLSFLNLSIHPSYISFLNPILYVSCVTVAYPDPKQTLTLLHCSFFKLSNVSKNKTYRNEGCEWNKSLQIECHSKFFEKNELI